MCLISLVVLIGFGLLGTWPNHGLKLSSHLFSSCLHKRSFLASFGEFLEDLFAAVFVMFLIYV